MWITYLINKQAPIESIFSYSKPKCKRNPLHTSSKGGGLNSSLPHPLFEFSLPFGEVRRGRKGWGGVIL